MITTILSVFSSTRMMALAGAAVIASGSLIGAMYYRGSAAQAEGQLARAKASLEATQRSLASSEAARLAELQERQRLEITLADLQAKEQSRIAKTTKTRKAVNRAKPTNVCSTSPAMRELLNGMRGK